MNKLADMIRTVDNNRNNNSVIHVFDMDDDEYYSEATNFKENR